MFNFSPTIVILFGFTYLINILMLVSNLGIIKFNIRFVMVIRSVEILSKNISKNSLHLFPSALIWSYKKRFFFFKSFHGLYSEFRQSGSMTRKWVLRQRRYCKIIIVCVVFESDEISPTSSAALGKKENILLFAWHRTRWTARRKLFHITPKTN